MLDARFSYESVLGAADRSQLVKELETELTRRLREASDPAVEGFVLVDELRRLGYDLWSFDESLDFQLWCGDWLNPKQPYELIVDLRYAESEASTASLTFRERRK